MFTAKYFNYVLKKCVQANDFSKVAITANI